MSKRVNAYTCGTCGKQTVTIDRDEGVTPFMLGCRVTPGCRGMGTSSFYRCDQNLTPTHEWYKPDVEELRRSDPAMADHGLRGGLFLRRIGGGPDKPPSGPQWRPMTDIERRAAASLSPGKVRYPVASPPKRLGRHLAQQASEAEPKITDGQAKAMWAQVYRFRRQVPSDIVKHAESIVLRTSLTPATEAQ